MSMRQVGALVFGLVFVLIATTAMAADCQEPTDFHDGWTVAAPEQEGLDPALICGIGPRLEALKEANAHGVVITRHGGLITDLDAPVFSFFPEYGDLRTPEKDRRVG